MNGVVDDHRLVVILCALSCVALLGGCSKKSNLGTVTGSVTLDGEPLKTGVIRFLPVDGQTATADAMITDGKYSASIPPGPKTISISAVKVVGKKKAYDATTGPEIDVTQEIVPARYNVQSSLTLTVEAGTLEHDFPLKTPK